MFPELLSSGFIEDGDFPHGTGTLSVRQELLSSGFIEDGDSRRCRTLCLFPELLSSGFIEDARTT